MAGNEVSGKVRAWEAEVAEASPCITAVSIRPVGVGMTGILLFQAAVIEDG